MVTPALGPSLGVAPWRQAVVERNEPRRSPPLSCSLFRLTSKWTTVLRSGLEDCCHSNSAYLRDVEVEMRVEQEVVVRLSAHQKSSSKR